ncbi:ATP-binding protein [Leptolyngbya sp. FACHB-16]|uniref:hybrid sensor histidine kinase/response regulator n=1 Tax=unclassified Leptolyngbya TaxID=2650499 RepID=UPI001681FE36|nr:ATP-binding protein [Leptolyngbya sp. FACHB-16]MBD2153677.1 response regulator [Leptolyngbya sp. FACHB-16]
MELSLLRLLSRFDPRRYLGIRLGLATTGTTLLLSIVLSLLVGYVSSLQLENTIQQSLHELAYQMADKLDRGMFERYRDIQVAATLDPIYQTASPATQRELLETLQTTYPNYAWIGLTDLQGTVTASTGGLLEGKDVSQRPWFQQAKLAPYVGDVHEAKLLAKLLPNPTNEPLRFVDVSVPVKDPQGQAVGILGAHLSWNWAKEVQQSLLAPIEQHRQVEIFILDHTNQILLYPTGFEGDRTTTHIGSLTNATDSQTNTRLFRQKGYLESTVQSQGYGDYPGLGWQVYVRQPTQIALAPARMLQLQVLAVGIGVGLLMALWSVQRSHRIVAPILRLAAAADAIQRGNPDVTIPRFRRQDEIALLSTSLSDLVETSKQQRQSLLEANQRLQADIKRQEEDAATIREQAALLNIATDAIMVLDLSGTIQFWNKGAEQIYGWSRAEVCYQGAQNLLHRATPTLEQANRMVLAEGAWQGELSNLTKSGQERIVQSRWTLVRNSNGQSKAFLVVDTDITEKKQLENQLLRTQRLESLGMLASGIAHDLNNILSPILIATQILPIKFPELDPSTSRLLDTLDISARRGGRLVKQILSFSRGLAGERSPVQVKHILSEIWGIAQSTFPKSIRLNLKLTGASLWMINADANQLHQVLMNLCVNARDAMPEGGTLTLIANNQILSEQEAQAYPDARAGNYVMITVADTGMGIAPDVLNHIFEPFFTTKEVGQGTGLGLSTTLGIIRSHGGFIQVTSKVGVGTQFHLYLPADPEQEATATPPEKRITGQGQLILVVDDEVRILEMLRTSLEAYNYRVLTARNGFEAINNYMANQSEIQLVLTDMMMPEMNGEDMVRVLHILNPDLKIVVVSGSKQSIREDLDVARFLPKPYNLEDLLQVIHQTLQHG